MRPPDRPKITRLGTTSSFRPNLSAMAPMTGASNNPGRVKREIMRLTWVFVNPKSCCMYTNDGAIKLTPITAKSVIPKIR